MHDFDFKTSAHAKCILAGEHAVVHGCPAIVLPVKSKTIDLAFKNFNQSTKVSDLASIGDVLHRLFWGAIEKSFEHLNKKFPEEIKGQFYLENNIEMGAGIGFSAALCVVIARWLSWRQWIKEAEIFRFARQLENVYHGQSSGLDIAGAMSDQIISFKQPDEIRKLVANWHPKLYLSYSGYAKDTGEAVGRVRQLKEKNPKKAQAIEEQMSKSVFLIEEALKQEKKQGMQLFISAIEQARGCFDGWGLITPPLQHYLDHLYQLGALAVKPTGAGLGGYVLSLWEKEPAEISEIAFIPI